MKKLSKKEMKNVQGGVMTEEVASGPCDSCTQLCHANDSGSYGWGMCSPSTGGTSCHNYCCSGTTYWC